MSSEKNDTVINTTGTPGNTLTQPQHEDELEMEAAVPPGKEIKKQKQDQKKQRKMLLQGVVLIIAIICICPVLIISIFSAGSLLAENTTGKYLNLTNIGFALFAGVATLMFNWARSLDDKNYSYEVNQINQIGEKAIITGIGFLIASLFQFMQTLPHDKGIPGLVPQWYYAILPILILLIFIFTSIYTILILAEIITIYAEVLHERKKLKNPE